MAARAGHRLAASAGLRQWLAGLCRLKFIKLYDGYFFENSLNKNVINVAKSYSENTNADWPGYEYSTNKIDLEDTMQKSIYEIATLVLAHIQELVNRFKSLYPGVKVVFWFGCDELGEYPSANLGFYVKRKNMLPLLPEEDIAVEAFPQPLMIAT